MQRSRVVGPTGLPIEDCVPGIRGALAERRAAVLRAEPGAGKSTVVPLRLLDEPWLGDSRIVMLEPRRLAARATARRMASLLGEEVGGTVGYRTRDESRVSRSTLIEVVTDGILTRRLQRDPSLEGTGLVIFDEVHERNLQSDLALALALDARRSLRVDLAVLAMSATLDTDRMAALLGEPGDPAPVVSSRGRSHPVELRWTPPEPGRRVAEATAAAVRTALRTDPGDLLVFLAGAAEIRRVAGLLGEDRALMAGIDVRPLHGGLPVDQQDAALAPSSDGRRRVVLSTDIAETSMTVEGVRVVIDSGEVRRPAFDHRSGLTRLRTGPASAASADQRAGRAGRTEAGVAYRLWSQQDHARRAEFSEPEIRTAELAGLALELAIWGADAADLPFLDHPPAPRLADAHDLLERLGALDDRRRPTEAGRAMSDLPLHPRLAHMVVAAAGSGHGWLACILAALLEERDVLRGHPSALPVDVEERARLVDDPQRRLASAEPGAVAHARRRAKELARRAGVTVGRPDVGAAGRVLALAYPDRLAQQAGGDQLRLRTGQRVRLSPTDPLHAERFLVVAETGPATRRGPTRPETSEGSDDEVRLAAALDLRDVEEVAGADIEVISQVRWDPERDDLEQRTERRLGALVLASTTERAAAGDETTQLLVDRVRRGGLDVVGWSSAARALQGRASFAHGLLGAPWPDVSDEALLAAIDEWLPPLLAGATRRADLERIDMTVVLRTMLGHRVHELDRVVPGSIAVAGGRRVAIDYGTDPPSIAARPQELYGTRAHPSIGDGRLPLAVHLLSPAGRVVQVTSDLPGFWAGTWSAVRKEMAGRYPKHDWPVDPANASPSSGPRRRAPR